MDERTALGLLVDHLAPAGDDAAVIDDLVVTIDMLHEETDFPDGTTKYTAGWRAVGASLSDVAAMGADPTAVVAVYAAPVFDSEELLAFVDGAAAVCDSVGATFAGGDLDEHGEFSTTTAAVGHTSSPVYRSDASPGDHVCVTGTLGRSAGALKLFETGEIERANDLFRFEPRIAAGRTLAPHASAMIDSSDGLARSLYQLANSSGVGFEIETPLPIDAVVDEVASDEADRLERGVFFGEDFELICTIPSEQFGAAQNETPTTLTPIGRVQESDVGVTLDGETLANRGYTHGNSG